MFGVEELLLHLCKSCGFCDAEVSDLRRALSALDVIGRASACGGGEAYVEERQPVLPVVEADAHETPPFFISIVGKRRLRRLHKSGGCPTSAAELREMIPLWSLEGCEYHFACKHCWRHGSQPGGSPSSDSSSSENSCEESSSSESLTDSE